MRVYYDGAIFGLQSRGGINRYFKQLIEGLGDRVTPLLSLTTPVHSLPPQSSHIQKASFSRFAFRPGRLSYYLEAKYFQWRCRRFDPDIIHPTYYELLTQEVPSKGRARVVATIFDLIHERFPGDTDSEGIHRRNKAKLAQRAEVLITLSENARENIIEYYGLTPDRVRCIYPGCSLNNEHGTLNNTPSVPPYLVFVGNRWSYKNFPIFLKLLHSTGDRFRSLRGKVIGPPFTGDELQVIADLHLAGRIDNLGYLDDPALASTLSGASALIYPSSYEGFGFPIIEAQANRCPVIAPPVSSIPEIGGDGVIYVMPSDLDRMIHETEKLIESSSYRESYISKGIDNCARFNWQKATDETFKLYQEVLR